ncbi:unnamed protein product [Allacma fusca]|uniref:Disintegrin domain-containing protein n=1 Tax=Allacma fusca TaxID=39272 RepID=A0A8J2JB49_9HEXA|nr:unnamed protein product [Allacma fusca]
MPKAERPLLACLVQDGGKLSQIGGTVLYAFGQDFKDLKKKLKLNTFAPFLYTGYFLNDADSWIFGVINKGGFLGQIYTQSRVFYIEKSLKYIEKYRLHRVLKFRNDEAVTLTNAIFDEKDLKEICFSTKQKRHAHSRHREINDDDDDEANRYFENVEEKPEKHHLNHRRDHRHHQEVYSPHYKKYGHEQPKHIHHQHPQHHQNSNIQPSENTASIIENPPAEDTNQHEFNTTADRSVPDPQANLTPVLQTEIPNGEESVSQVGNVGTRFIQQPADVTSDLGSLNYYRSSDDRIQDGTSLFNQLEPTDNKDNINAKPLDKFPENDSFPQELPPIVNYNSEKESPPGIQMAAVVGNPDLATGGQEPNDLPLTPSPVISDVTDQGNIQSQMPVPVEIVNYDDKGSPETFPEEGVYSTRISELPVETASNDAKRFPPLQSDLNRTITFAVAADNMFYKNVGDSSIVITVARILYFMDRVEWVFRSTAWGKNGLPDNVGFNIEQLAIELDRGRADNVKSFEAVVKRFGKMTIGFSAKVSAKDVAVTSTYDDKTPSNVLVLVIVTVVDSDGKELPDIIIIRRILKALLRAASFADTSGTFSPDCDSTEAETPKKSFIFQNLEINKCFRRRIHTILHKSTTNSKHSLAFCGNGILEKGEQCDCGPLKQCLKFGKPCCYPRGNFGNQCKFTVGSQCYDPLGICCNSTTCTMFDMLNEGLSCTVQTCNSYQSLDPQMTGNSEEGRLSCGALIPEVNPRVRTNCFQDRCQSDECSRLNLSECTCSQANLRDHCSTCCVLPEEGCVPSDIAAERVVNNIRSSFVLWKLKSGINNNPFNDFIKSHRDSYNIWTALSSEIQIHHKPSESVDKRVLSKEFCIEDSCVNINFLHWRAGGPCVIHGVVSYCGSNLVCQPNYQIVASKDERLGKGMLLDGNYSLPGPETGSSGVQIFPEYLLSFHFVYLRVIFCMYFWLASVINATKQYQCCHIWFILEL